VQSLRDMTVFLDHAGPGALSEQTVDHHGGFPPRNIGVTSSRIADSRIAEKAPSGPPGRSGQTSALLNELAALAVHGDKRATEELLKTVRAMVLPYCRARLGDKQRTIDSPEDVAQEICLAVLVALAHYQIRGLSFRAFVYGIAAHKVTDAFRAAARERSEPMADPADDSVEYDGPEQRVLRAEQSERLSRLLAVLSDRQREILVLRFVMGFSAVETARAVHSTPGSVRVLQHRALNQLRGEVAGAKVKRQALTTSPG
jgi:RNA polymerase sigma-70 factor (ECF subfamily)